MKRSALVAALLAVTFVVSHSISTGDTGPSKLTVTNRLVGEALARFTGADSILDTSSRSSFKFRVEAVAQEIRKGVWRYEYQVTPLSGAQLETFGLDTPAEAKLEASKGWSTATSWESRSHVAVWSLSTGSKRSGKLRFSLESPLPPRPVACFGEPVGDRQKEGEGDGLVGRTVFDVGSTGLTLGPGRGSESRASGRQRLSVEATPPPGSAAVGFEVHRPGGVRVVVADSTGQAITVLTDRQMAPGKQGAFWNGLGGDHHPVRPGQYSFRLLFNGREVSSAPILVPR